LGFGGGFLLAKKTQEGGRSRRRKKKDIGHCLKKGGPHWETCGGGCSAATKSRGGQQKTRASKRRFFSVSLGRCGLGHRVRGTPPLGNRGKPGQKLEMGPILCAIELNTNLAHDQKKHNAGLRGKPGVGARGERKNQEHLGRMAMNGQKMNLRNNSVHKGGFKGGKEEWGWKGTRTLHAVRTGRKELTGTATPRDTKRGHCCFAKMQQPGKSAKTSKKRKTGKKWCAF